MKVAHNSHASPVWLCLLGFLRFRFILGYFTGRFVFFFAACFQFLCRFILLWFLPRAKMKTALNCAIIQIKRNSRTLGCANNILARVTGAGVDFNKNWKAGKAFSEISVIIFYRSLTAVTNIQCQSTGDFSRSINRRRIWCLGRVFSR